MRIEPYASTGKAGCRFLIIPENDIERMLLKQFLKVNEDKNQKLTIGGETYEIPGGLKSFDIGWSDHDHRFPLKRSLWKRIKEFFIR